MMTNKIVEPQPTDSETLRKSAISAIGIATKSRNRKLLVLITSEDTATGILRHMSLRDLPGVDTLTAALAVAPVARGLPETLVTDVARRAIERTRTAVLAGENPQSAEETATADLASLAQSATRPVINATGVLLHTNLGRASVHPSAAEAAAAALRSASNLEFDLATQHRGGRGNYGKALLVALTGAEAALIVNNNAAALFLALATLSSGRRAVVSRGELIEIGGSFRLPELMAATGAIIDEVGTTNRTRKGDYERVMAGAALALKVHPSNYRIAGFTEEASWAEVAEVAHAHGVPMAADVGSGLLDATVPWVPGPPPKWLANEPGVKQTLEAGADLVLFSGDKLIGGPQAGIVVGTKDLVTRLAKHPIARSVRISGGALAALETTLALYADDRVLEIPFWRQATIPLDELSDRHQRLIDSVPLEGALIETDSVPGAGTVPGVGIPTVAAAFVCTVDTVWSALLRRELPIATRRQDGTLVVDLRSTPSDTDQLIADALTEVVGTAG
jgi:L-seryl-tRNA(Ser) seleniumtransferase